MGPSGAAGADRALILETVANADHRLRLGRYLRELVGGSALVLYAALILLVVAHILPVRPALAFWTAGVGVPLWALFRAWVLARQSAPARAAGWIDRAASLDDELWSAHWFASTGESSLVVDLHVRRAAASASGVNLSALLPIAPPRRALGLLAIVAAMLLAVSLIPLEWSRSRLRGSSPAVLTDAELGRLDAIERLLASDPERSPDRAAIKARIDELLRKLREGGLSAEETLALVDELRQLLGAVSAGADVREALARAGDVLAGDSMTDAVGRALQDQRPDEAARRMRELASSMEQAMRGGTPLGQLQATLNRAASQARQGFERFAGDLSGAAVHIGRRTPEDARASLERSAEDLEAAASIQEFEPALQNANRQLDGLEQSLGSRFGPSRESGPAAQRDEPKGLASTDTSPQGSTPSPQTGDGRPVPGKAGESQGAMVAASDQPGSSAPGPLGAPSIAAAGAPGRIDVARRREVLPVEPLPDERMRERLVDEETRATRATVPYRAVDVTPSYAEAAPLTTDPVPPALRDLVKSYFRVVGPRGSKER